MWTEAAIRWALDGNFTRSNQDGSFTELVVPYDYNHHVARVPKWQSKIRRVGEPLPRGYRVFKPWKPEELQQVLDMRMAGMSLEAIGEKLGRGWDSVKAAVVQLTEEGHEFPTMPKRPPDRLAAEFKMRVKAMLDEGHKKADIIRAMATTKYSVNRAIIELERTTMHRHRVSKAA
jgi:transposase